MSIIRSWWNRLHYQHGIAFLAIVLVFVDTFFKPLNAISLGLLIVAAAALSPWWSLIPNVLKSAELPGGLKFEFRDKLESATHEAEQAGLLSEPAPEQKDQLYEMIYNNDPQLSLAKLRIELERQLRELATIANVPARRSLSTLVESLEDAEALSHEQAAALRDLLPLLNKAIHSEEFSRDSADWAINVGPQLLSGLEQQASKRRRRSA